MFSLFNFNSKFYDLFQSNILKSNSKITWTKTHKWLATFIIIIKVLSPDYFWLMITPPTGKILVIFCKLRCQGVNCRCGWCNNDFFRMLTSPEIKLIDWLIDWLIIAQRPVSNISAIFRSRTSSRISKKKLNRNEWGMGQWGNNFWLPMEKYGYWGKEEKISLL